MLSGHGFGFVAATGAATQYGSIAELVAQTTSSTSPLQGQAAVQRRIDGRATALKPGLKVDADVLPPASSYAARTADRGSRRAGRRHRAAGGEKQEVAGQFQPTHHQWQAIMP